MKLFISVLARFGIVLGVLLVFFGLLELLDPVGAKHADDGDPFGPPNPWYYSLAMVVAGGALVWGCIRSVLNRDQSTNR